MSRGESPDGLIARRGAEGRLQAAPDTPLVLLTAPLGAGKTALLRRWAGTETRPFVRLAVDLGHNEPRRLVDALTGALATAAGADPADVAALAADPAPAATAALTRLGKLVAGCTRSFVLALDGVQALESPFAAEALSVVVDNVPPGSQLALATRHAPPVPLGRLRERRDLLHLGADDLALSVEEVDELLCRWGLRAPRVEVQALTDRTEGWAAAVSLAAQAAAGSGDPRGTLRAFGGDDWTVVEYLTDEVLRRLPTATMRFLTRTSVLDRMCGALCDQVLHSTGSGLLLRRLYEANLFVRPLDRAHTWYRQHRVLAEALRAELLRREPELVPELHARAAAWYERSGHPERALRHAQAAGDVRAAARLAWWAAGREPGREPTGGPATGTGPGDPTALTAAELRVLRHLPTHLSFQEIGARLSVSRNTVKTQAIAAYRKLGVASRGDAVRRATECGLLATPVEPPRPPGPA
jgi:LuxR family maltose regulon positive regulatory protein